ncbi:MAG TPA: L,D-transpeptidase family protein [Syntrophales bacterium]|nr:L,D-transpeptidase family protein [Syntrophales bacterium]
MNVRLLNLTLKTIPAALAATVFLFSFSVSVPASAMSPATDGPVDRIIVEKSKRTMTLLKQDKEVRTYKIALGRNPEGPKVQKGDKRTPEGLYFVDYKVRKSIYHRALHLNYPNQDDIERARSLGVTPGNSIMIHGMKQDKLWMGDVQYLFNWTNGCIALTNDEIEEVWNLVSIWTPVEIRP